MYSRRRRRRGGGESKYLVCSDAQHSCVGHVQHLGRQLNMSCQGLMLGQTIS